MEKAKSGGIFSAVGAVTGLGNAFRFPALCAKYGLSFIFAYALCLALIGFPLLCAELSFGRSKDKKSSKFALFIMRLACANSAVIALYYGVIACKLSGACINFAVCGSLNSSNIWAYISALFIFPAVFFILKKGNSALNITGKISVFAFLSIFSYLAVKGITYGSFKFNFTNLICGEVWAEAVGQTLLSLSLAGGVMPNCARTMPQTSLFFTAFKIVIANFLGCVLAQLAVCPVLLDTDVEGGIACAFTVYPQVIYALSSVETVRRIFGALLYGALTAVSIHSLCSLATPLLSHFNSKGLPAFLFCLLSALIAPVLCLNDCSALSACDRVACCITAVLVAFLECLLFAKGVFNNRIIGFLLKFVCPIVCGASSFLSVCSARFFMFSSLSLTLAVCAGAFPLVYALLPLIKKLKNKFAVKPNTP
ncbi:MAG: hypothetical protein ACI4MS_04250 [Candidatus Coproplasma sp.]